MNIRKMLVSGGEDQDIIVWNLIEGTKNNIFIGHNNYIWRVIVTEDEKYIVSGDFTDGIRIWNMEKMQQEFNFNFQEQASSWLEKNGIELVSVRGFLKA